MARWVVVAALCSVVTAARADVGGFTATVGAGVNVDTPFVEAQVGRRFRRAPFFEAFLDYSYDRPISLFSFQTFGVGARTYFAHPWCIEVFHQAVAAFAISSSGTSEAPNRDLGQRLLGGILTQGIGAQLPLGAGHRWAVALTVSTGTPVWLRPELAVRGTF
jgi:hypothetical protein